MPGQIFHGVWVNWAHGAIGGATLTLSERQGGLLIAFIAFFVTLVGAQLFKILNFTFHQIRSRASAQDGLYHQQQVIFRNSSSASGAAWNFLLQTWAWKNKANRSWMRTLPWALFCVVYAVAFGAAAIFSSEITTHPGSARLLVGDGCGYWSTIGDVTSQDAIKAYTGRLANTSLANSAYARDCYGGTPNPSCDKMIKPALKTKSNVNASCPFADGMCEWGDNAAYEIMSERIDSLYDLGINSRHSDRLQFQKMATCSPISKDGFWQTIPGGTESGKGIEGDTLFAYMYGPSKSYGGSINSTDYTYLYNNHTTLDGVGYRLWTDYYLAGQDDSSAGWRPIPELNQTGADLNIMFLSQNSISYAEPVDDPFFSAHLSLDFGSLNLGFNYYTADWYVNIMACADQYQICNPENQVCTGMMGVNQVLPWIVLNNEKLELNTIQQAISIRMMRHAFETSVQSIVLAQVENGLLAREYLVEKLSQGLPLNQWQLEVDNFFNKGLAQFQLATVEYAAGPIIGPGAALEQPWNTSDSASNALALNVVAEAMCHSQVINDSTDSISFSVAGIIVLFAFGGLIILVSLFIDTLVGWIQRRFNIGTHARMCWLLDDTLQLHRYLNQELGQGHWSDDFESMPNTVSSEKFSTLARAHERNAEKPVKYPVVTSEEVSVEHAAPAYQGSTAYQGASPYQETESPSYQGVGYPGRGYTQITTSEEQWQAK